MEPDVIDVNPNSQVTRRRVISGIAGVGAAVIAGTTLVRAQESTPEAGTDSTTDDTTVTTTPVDKRAENYQTFLTKLAAELSLSDTTTLDTDIRDALKAMVDDVLAAGDLAANDATDMKAAIDESTSPIRFGLYSDRANGLGGFGGPGMSEHRSSGSGKPGTGTDEETDDSDSTATPTT